MTLHFAEQPRMRAGFFNIGSGQARSWLS